MNIQRKNQMSLILCSFTSLLKEFNFGLEIFKDGSIVFVDGNNNDRYKISAEDFQDLYDKTEVGE
ncbi:hypothetical protein [Anaerococcus sp. Marseille-P3625]|uniref:hypothetical protein n=1 Tax=Anaerococcus sp. Marseille-P3625 TaxID=1977277 RepID=UPI000C08C58D|nr:hypothetical protein [Anaerococcus sp. Marseille-P3625]